MRREYYLHQRTNGIFYVEFINPENGRKLSARSTGETDLKKAQFRAELWLEKGVPTGKTKKTRPIAEASSIENVIRAIKKSDLNDDDALLIVEALKTLKLIDIQAVSNVGRGAVPFVEFLEEFWDYDRSEYINDRLVHGYRFTKRYARTCLAFVNKYIKPLFLNKKLNMITLEDLKQLANDLAEKKLSTSSINQITFIAQTPLRWAYKHKIIKDDPTQGLTKFSVVNKTRGCLTVAEATAVFSVDWIDLRAFCASLLACTTGMRQGECLALKINDIINATDYLKIQFSYSSIDGLKCPKNGFERNAPLLPIVRNSLLELIETNPYKNQIENPFIFYSTNPYKPVVPNLLSKGLKDAMDKVNVKYLEESKKANLEKPEIFIKYRERGICFHSWRHFFCSKITEIIDAEKVAKVSGHLSESVFKKYAEHIEIKNIIEVSKAAASVFENVIQFPIKKAG